MNLISNYVFHLNSVFHDIGKFSHHLPSALTNDNIWAAIIGTLLGAAIVDFHQAVNEKNHKVDQYNALIVIVITVLEEMLSVKRQFSVKIVEDLKQAHLAYYKSLSTGKLELAPKYYLNQFPIPRLYTNKAMDIVTTSLVKSTKLMRTFYRLDSSVDNVIVTLQNRNNLVNPENIRNAPTVNAEEQLKQIERLYGFPTKNGKDKTLSNLTEHLDLYCDDVIHFCRIALKNLDKYAEHFFDRRQRNRITKYEIEEMNSFMPSDDHLKLVTESLVIPSKKFFWNSFLEKIL